MKGVLQRLSQIEGGIVLDAATGRGEFINVIKSNFKSYSQVIGVDYSEKLITYAQKLFPENDIEIYKMNLEELAFEDNHFDTITMANSLHHLEHPKLVFKELMRVLKPGGLFVLGEMYCDGSQTEAQITHIHLHHWMASVDRLNGIYHNETFSRSQVIDFAKGLGLKKQEVIDYYYPVENPKASKNCETLIKTCTETIKRLELHNGNSELISEGKKLIGRIEDVGCASASRLMIIGVK